MTILGCTETDLWMAAYDGKGHDTGKIRYRNATEVTETDLSKHFILINLGFGYEFDRTFMGT